MDSLYRTGLHLAPMVRIGTLTTRLLSLHYGATLVWGPEIVAHALMGARKTVCPQRGTVQFLGKDDRLVFECHPMEKSRLIFQLGVADADMAVTAAKLVQDHCRGIGVNAGCPKPFSVTGGMGARLLSDPDRLCTILRRLVAESYVPIDVKIRLLPDQADTLKLVSRIAETGVSALTVHCRTESMRPREPALLHRLRDIVDFMRPHHIPVIANGDCFSIEDAPRIKELTGVSSIMVARGAERNPSCFAESLEDPIAQVCPLFVRVASAVGAPPANAKYCLNAMDFAATKVKRAKAARSASKQTLSRAKTMRELCEVFGVDATEASTKTVEQLDLRIPG